MTMEFEGFGSTRWTSNSAHAMQRAPGGQRGLSGMPGRRRLNLAGLHESGFAAEDATPAGDDILVLAKKWAFAVTRQPVGAGQIPSMLVKMRFTDRGTLTKEQLDAQILPALKAAGMKVSLATNFVAQPVTWRLEHDTQGDFYFPVVASPAALAGLRYSGNAVTLPVYSADTSILSKLPSSLYIYTLATTSTKNTMSDGDGAAVLTVFRTWLQNQKAGAYATGEAVLLGSPPEVFETPSVIPAVVAPVVKAGISGLILLAAWNLISVHIGSERL